MPKLIENLELTVRGRHIKEHSLGFQAGYDKGYSEGLKAVMELINE